jgi:hypothetical protein
MLAWVLWGKGFLAKSVATPLSERDAFLWVRQYWAQPIPYAAFS